MPVIHQSALVADLERRFQAFVVDRLIAWTLFALATVAAWWWFFREHNPVPGVVLIVATVVVVSVAFSVLLGVKGVTPGKAVLGLRVVSHDGGAPIGIGRAVLRTSVVGIGSLPMFGLGLATLAWTAVEDRNRERRGWHDHVAKSVVIDVRPLPDVEAAAEERPRHVVNLTAMKLVPVRGPAAPVVPAPLVNPVVAAPVAGASRAGTEAPRAPGPPGTPPPCGETSTAGDRENAGNGSGTGGPGSQTPESRRRRIDAPWREAGHATREATGSPDPVPDDAPAAAPIRSSAPAAPPAGPPAPAAPPAGPPAPGATSGRHAGPPRHQPPGPSIIWRVTFDTGETFVVEGLGLVGRQPVGRAGESVRYLVPLTSRDMSISKTHAQFHLAADGALVVMDRGSTNGSLLIRKGVSRHLSPGRPATLIDGDHVAFGDRTMTVSRDNA